MARYGFVLASLVTSTCTLWQRMLNMSLPVKDVRVIICDSLPSIEYWFLLHHLNTNRYFGTSKAVVKELLHYIPNFEKTERFLSTHKWVEDLCADEKMELASTRALTFGNKGESYTNIPRLLQSCAPQDGGVS